MGECKDELMVALGQFTLLLDGKSHHKTQTVSNADADADRDRTNVLSGLIHEFETIYDSLKSYDDFLVSDPSTWPQEMPQHTSTVLATQQFAAFYKNSTETPL